MSALHSLVRSISSNSKGHWGIIEPTSPPISSDQVDQLKGASSVAFLHFKACRDELVLRSEIDELVIGDLGSYLETLIKGLAGGAQRTVRILVSSFHLLSTEDQCSVVRQTRSIRESCANVSVQTILHGSWNIYRLQEYWKAHLSDTSPAPDRKHIFFKEETDVFCLLDRLSKAGCISYGPTPIDQIGAKAILEITGGDSFFVDYIIDALRAQQLGLSEFETIIDQLYEAGTIQDAIKSRLTTVSPDGWSIIDAILKNQFTRRPHQDADTEDLRLLGIIKLRRAGTSSILTIASPIIERILRNRWTYFAPFRKPIYNGPDLARPILALNTAAYQYVFEIENVLRNLIILVLESSSSLGWQGQIKSIKAGPRSDGDDSDPHTVLLERILSVVQRLSPTRAIDNMQEAERTQEPTLEDDKPVITKPKNISIVESAENWRSRQLNSPALELSHASLIYFFTTENIVKSFFSKPLYQEVWGKHFPEKDEFITLIQNYITIRAAVAHNQPVNLKTIHRLMMIQDDLQKLICVGFK